MTTTWVGVDVDDMGCTGASRTSGVVGASALAIATLEFEGVSRWPQGLAAWRAAPESDRGTAAVETLGLWSDTSPLGTEAVTYADGSGTGLPLTLGDTVATTGGVASFDGPSSGYLVVLGDPAGGVRVAEIDPLPAPLTECGTAPCSGFTAGPDGRFGTADDGPPRSLLVDGTEPRTNAELATPRWSSLLPATAGVREVSIATRSTASETHVLVAVSTGAEILLSVGTLSATTGMITETSMHHVPVVGSLDLRVVHVDAGIAAPLGTADEPGGFVVTWSTRSGTFAARVTDADESLMPAVRLGDASEAPMAYLDGAPDAERTLRVAAVLGDDVVAFPHVCGTL